MTKAALRAELATLCEGVPVTIVQPDKDATARIARVSRGARAGCDPRLARVYVPFTPYGGFRVKHVAGETKLLQK
jgi:hypothetical protein